MHRERTVSADLLRAYLEAQDSERAGTALGELLSRGAEPLIETIVRSKLGRIHAANPADVEDVCSEATVALIARLEEFRNEPAGEPLADFEAFVSVIAYRACSGFFRRARPEFHRLRNRLRYLIETRKGMTIWEDEQGVWWCALERWRHKTAPAQPLDHQIAGRLLPHDPVTAVTEVLETAGAPVSFDELARILADAWEIPGGAGREPEELVCPSPSAETSMAQRQWIERLWREICDLPPAQRTALLLNLHDRAGESVTTLLAVTRVAGLGEIAKALQMNVEAFARIWRELPWSDLRIAELLGMNRQQVINLRKCARERLGRRMLRGEQDSARVW
ncbi:MAG TPA: hypothetical protein VMI94_14305 [Bryobacteraceae bacterium]|nr:hypothetical protein [Bryobacteraceae bacterium]